MQCYNLKGSEFANKVVPISSTNSNNSTVAAGVLGAATAIASNATNTTKETLNAVKETGVASAAAVVGSVGAAATTVKDKATALTDDTASYVTGASSGSNLGWLKWLLPLLLLGGAFLLWKSCDKKEATETTSTVIGADTSTVKAALPKVTVDTTTGVVNYDLGASTELDLGNGVKLTGIAKEGFENTLYNFIKTR